MAEETKETKQEQTQETQQEARFTQKDLDDFAAKARSAYERKESSLKEELEELRQFRQEHQKKAEEQNQKELEEQKKYEEALKLKENNIQELTKKLEEAQTEKQRMAISNKLTSEIMKQGLYPEAVDLLKSNATLDDNGEVRIKGKDSNNIDTLLSVEEGVKKFKSEKPYLVKSDNKGGAGTATAETAGTEGTQKNLQELNNALAVAMKQGDRKRVNELKTQIRATQGAGQVARIT